MNNKYLFELAQQILVSSGQGLSKVRFAKTIYYVHKALVLKGFSKSEDLRFVRMPLGPVPVGFKDLTTNSHIGIKKEKNGLTYNAEIYFAKDSSLQRNNESSPRLKLLEKISRKMLDIPTSVLVAHSHSEPSWVNNRNGAEFALSLNDLRRGLPLAGKGKVLNPEVDEQHLQAQLLNGMVDEMVDETTALEYPAE